MRAVRLAVGGIIAALGFITCSAAQTLLAPPSGTPVLPKFAPFPSVPVSSATERLALANDLKQAAIAGANNAVKVLRSRSATLSGSASDIGRGLEIDNRQLAILGAIVGRAAISDIHRNPPQAESTLATSATIAQREAGQVADAVKQASGAPPSAALTILQSAANNSLIYTFQPPRPAESGVGSLGPQVAVFDQGGPTTHFESVALLILENNGSPVYMCSGTLIRPDKVLTAAHCFCPWSFGDPPQTVQRCVQAPTIASDRSRWHVYLDFAGLIEVKSIAVDNAYKMSDQESSDGLAVVQLAASAWVPVDSVINGLINLQNQVSDASGFGYSYVNRSNPLVGAFPINRMVPPGIKVVARGSVQTCPAGHSANICWNNTPNVQIIGATCDGDSGGPILLDKDGSTIIAVTSLGAPKECGKGLPTVGSNLQLKTSQDFLAAAVGSAAGGGQHFTKIRELPSQPLSHDGRFSYAFSVPTDFPSVIVAANAPAGSPIGLDVSPVVPSSPGCVPTTALSFQAKRHASYVPRALTKSM